MPRALHISRDEIDTFVTLFSLRPEKLAKLDEVLKSIEHETVLDRYIAVMNAIGVGDDAAEDIVDTYLYVQYAIERSGAQAPAVLDEVADVLAHGPQTAANAAMNLRDNILQFQKLFELKPDEADAEKVRYLRSGTYNSVIALRSICDARPVFNRGRTGIQSWILPVYIEMTVTNSTGESDVLLVTFDERALERLRSELNSIDRKRAMIRSKLEGNSPHGR